MRETGGSNVIGKYGTLDTKWAIIEVHIIQYTKKKIKIDWI